MRVLAIDIGSSSVKAAVLTGPRPSQVARESFITHYDGVRSEVPSAAVLTAVKKAIAALGDAARTVDVVVPTGMAPSWLAIDANGRALTPVVTHQDRRSQAEAEAIEAAVGRARHLHLTGNRPTPGGISSTTARWYVRHAKPLMRRADLIGHLNTWLVCYATDARVIDTSNASFTGLYRTTNLGGWDDDLIAAAQVKRGWLPRVTDARTVAGRVTRQGARRLGLTAGTPMLAGFVDGSGGLIAKQAKAGCVLNVVGSTDVLAVVTDRAKPIDGLLTRAVGVGRQWVSVGTVAAAGSALDWAHRTLFRDLTVEAYRSEVARLVRRPTDLVQFDARLAGSRTDVEPVRGVLAGLTLGTDRRDILSALLDSLARQSADRFARFRAAGVAYGQHAYTTGGGDAAMSKIFRRDWPGQWTFEPIHEATLGGAWALAEQAVED
ncbi:MAG TPA: FGGY family carbohydrate kinase [Tepidisphaeraceae bacterium]|jgi:sugar (pentulose or hexulose) kinase